jgi:hypothetical protein
MKWSMRSCGTFRRSEGNEGAPTLTLTLPRRAGNTWLITSPNLRTTVLGPKDTSLLVRRCRVSREGNGEHDGKLPGER